MMSPIKVMHRTIRIKTSAYSRLATQPFATFRNPATMALPVIVCGQTEQIGSGVVAGLKPEIDVVFFHLASGDAKEELSTVLKGKVPENPASTLGSGNISSTPPKAVVLGGAFEFEKVKSLQQTVNEVPGVKAVPWLMFDREKPAPPLGPEYGKHVVGRVKETLLAMQKEGKLDSGDGGIHKY